MTARKRRPQKSAKREPKPVTHYDVWKSFRGEERYFCETTTSKRRATRSANRMARTIRPMSGVRPRQVSVYMRLTGQERGRLLYQVHYSSKLKRLIAEEL